MGDTLQIMFLQSLLTCLVLSTFSAQAKVVDSFEECSSFFYEGKEPQGMDQRAKKICQKLENKDFLYATLYSEDHRIPLYSAYIFYPGRSNTSRTPPWHLEPQLYSRNMPDHMMLETDCKKQVPLQNLQLNQAVNSDYDKTGYERGHLYPNSFQSGDNRRATYTLTNAAPMDACFNHIHWKKWEGNLKTFLNTNLAMAYIVTGTVPGETSIPESKNRVTVPSHVWTAVCYKPPFTPYYISFGYIGINQPEFNIKLMSIPEMNVQLSQLYGKLTPSVQIFYENCFHKKESSEYAQIEYLNRINLPAYQRQKMFEGAQRNYLAVQHSISSYRAGPIITELTATLAFESSSSYFTFAETLKKRTRTACLLISHDKRRKIHKIFDLSKRDVSESSESLKCQLVPEKSVEKLTAADGSQCTSFEYDGYVCTCVTTNNQITKLCCSTPCLYQDELNDYQCYSGSTLIKCSPQYSLITINGKRCRGDHPCATYGRNYYWCKTDESEECCHHPTTYKSMVTNPVPEDLPFCQI